MKYLEENLDRTVRDILPAMQDRIVTSTCYFGIKTQKNPVDFWVYQEMLFEVKPDIIIEIGNLNGGSTLALAHILDALNKGTVIGIDIDHHAIDEQVRLHARIELIQGDACALAGTVEKLIKPGDVVFIIEDSSHTHDNTLKILRRYSHLVTLNSYFIVEDSICHHGLDVGPDPGPFEAVEDFIQENKQFVIDRTRESFFITWNPKGFLKRIS
jgi:cephalosporin hydroxylase